MASYRTVMTLPDEAAAQPVPSRKVVTTTVPVGPPGLRGLTGPPGGVNTIDGLAGDIDLSGHYASRTLYDAGEVGSPSTPDFAGTTTFERGTAARIAAATGISTKHRLYTGADRTLRLGDATTAIKDLPRFIDFADLKKRAYSPRDFFDCKGDDGITDNEPYINATIQAAQADGRPVYIPQDKKRYMHVKPLIQLPGVPIIGDGSHATKLHSAPPSNATFPNYHGIIQGAYFNSSGANTFGAYSEPGFVGSAAQFSTTFVCTTPARAGNFAAGNIVAIDGVIAGPSANLANELNYVMSADPATGIIRLRYPLWDDYTATGCSIRKMNTDPATGTLPDPLGRTGMHAHLLVDPVLAGFTYTADGALNAGQPVGQSLHLSGWGGRMHDLVVFGVQTLAGNPMAHYQIDRCRFYFTNCGAQVGGYYAHDNEFTDCWFVRTGVAQGGVHGGIWDGLTEGSKHNRYNNCTVIDVMDALPDSPAVATVQLGPDSTFDGYIFGGRQGVPAVQMYDRSKLGAKTLIDSKNGGPNIRVSGPGVVIEDGVRTQNTPAGSTALDVTALAVDCYIGDTLRGRSGARTAQDVIKDVGTNNVIKPGIGYSTLPRLSNDNSVTITGSTTEQTVFEQLCPAGSVQTGQGWRLLRMLWLASGAAGTKTFRIKILTAGSVQVLSLVVPAADGLMGSMDGRLVARPSNGGAASRWNLDNGASGGQSSLSIITAAAKAGWTGIRCTVQLVSAADSVTIYGWELEQIVAGAPVSGNTRTI